MNRRYSLSLLSTLGGLRREYLHHTQIHRLGFPKNMRPVYIGIGPLAGPGRVHQLLRFQPTGSDSEQLHKSLDCRQGASHRRDGLESSYFHRQECDYGESTDFRWEREAYSRLTSEPLLRFQNWDCTDNPIPGHLGPREGRPAAAKQATNLLNHESSMARESMESMRGIQAPCSIL